MEISINWNDLDCENAEAKVRKSDKWYMISIESGLICLNVKCSNTWEVLEFAEMLENIARKIKEQGRKI